MNKRNVRGNTERRYISTNELCPYLGCGTNTAYKVGKAAGAFIKLGRRTVFDIRAIDAYMNNLRISDNRIKETTTDDSY